MAGRRSAFMRYRLGSLASGAGTPPTLAPGWLTIYSPAIGAPETVARGSVVLPVAGQIDFRREEDVRVGDLLKDQATGRIFTVAQMQDRPVQRRVLVAEVFPPIPDEFESGLIEAYWDLDGNWAINQTLGELVPVTVSLADPAVASFCYQLLQGDFDVFTWVFADVGSSGAVRYALLKVQLNLLGPELTAVGVKNNGKGVFVRVDKNPGIVETVEGSLSAGLYGFVRLKREGARFRTFYASATHPPTEETEWREINPPVNAWTSAADVLIGLAAYQNAGTTGSMRFRFLRNWRKP